MWSSLFGKSQPAAAQDATAPASSASTPSSSSQPLPQPVSPPQTTINTPPVASSLPSSPPDGLPPPSDFFSKRSAKQFGLFVAGATFFALSTTVTRRSVARKQLASQLKFYQPSGSASAGVSRVHKADAPAGSAGTVEDPPHGSLMALEALNLATLNVVSFFMMLTGGFAWAFDISSIEDAKRRVQHHTRVSIGGSTGQTDEEAEREVEEFVARVLSWTDSKKDAKQEGGSEGSEDSSKASSEPKKEN